MVRGRQATCRGCLMVGKSKDMQPLVGVIRNIFLKCSAIEVLPDDPQHICFHCYRQTTSWASFRIMVQKKERQFRKKVPHRSVAVKVEEVIGALVKTERNEDMQDIQKEKDKLHGDLQEVSEANLQTDKCQPDREAGDHVSFTPKEEESRMDEVPDVPRSIEELDNIYDDISSDQSHLSVVAGEVTAAMEEEMIEDHSDDPSTIDKTERNSNEIEDQQQEPFPPMVSICDDVKQELINGQSADSPIAALPVVTELTAISRTDQITKQDPECTASDEGFESDLIESMEIKSEIDIGLKWEIYDEDEDDSEDDDDEADKSLDIKFEEDEEEEELESGVEEDLDDIDQSFYSQLFEDIEVGAEGNAVEEKSVDEPVIDATQHEEQEKEVQNNLNDTMEVDIEGPCRNMHDELDDDENEDQDQDMVEEVDKEDENQQVDEVVNPAVVIPPSPDIRYCPICYVQCEHELGLRDHLKSAHTFGEYPNCPVCHLQFTRITKVYSHIASNHKINVLSEEDIAARDQNIVTCPLCVFKCNHKDLYNHVRDTHNSRGLTTKCTICGKRFVNLAMHVMRSHSSRWTCPSATCSRKSFSKMETFNTHIRRKHPEIPKKGACPICKEEFKGFLAFCNHLNGKHLKEDSRCPKCFTHFDSIEENAVHVLECCKEDEPSVRPFEISASIECHLCQDEFVTFQAYSRHFSQSHSVVEVLESPSNRAFQTSTPKTGGSQLKLCPHCGKEVHHLYFHLRRRSTCRFCAKKFCTIRAMKTHIELMHNGRHQYSVQQGRVERPSSASVFVKYSYR